MWVKTKRNGFFQYVSLMLIGLFLFGCFVSLGSASAYTDSNSISGCANLTGIYLNGDTGKSLSTGQYVYQADGTFVQQSSESEYPDAPLQPSFKIQYSKNIIGKSPAYYNYSVNKDLISLVKAGDNSKVPVSVEKDASINNFLMLKVAEDNALLPETSYNIIIEPGIISGQSPYPATKDKYVALFKTGPLWLEQNALGVNNVVSNGLRLTWPAVDYSFIQGFQVYKDGTLLDTINDPAATYYDVINLSPDTNYTFAIKAIDRSNNVVGQLEVEASTPVDDSIDIVLPNWNAQKVLKPISITTSSVKLNWQGAEDNIGVTGYKVLQDGNLITDALDGNTATYEVTGLTSGTTYKFEVEARDAKGNWSTDGPKIDLTTGLPLNTQATLTVNQAVNVGEGVSVLLKETPRGSNHRVAVRRAESEVPQNHASNGQPVEWSMLYYANLKGAGGVYGFNLQADGSADTDTVAITLPITDLQRLADGNVGVFRLNEFCEDPNTGLMAHTWKMQDARIDPVNQTATVDITGCNQDVILGVFYHAFYPDGLDVAWDGIADDRPSITMTVRVGCSPADLKEIVLKREDKINGEIKNISITDNLQQSGPLPQYVIEYVDTDVQLGHYYLYTIASATDKLNNVGAAWRTYAATPGSKETAMSYLKQFVQNGNAFQFPVGDSKDSITRNFLIQRGGAVPSPYWDILFTSDRPDIVSISDYCSATVTQPQDQDTVVNLKAQVVFGRYTDQYNHEPYLQEEVTVPVTVKKAGPTPETYNIDYDTDPLNLTQSKNFAWADFNRVIQLPEVKTITFSKSFDLMHSSQIDPNGMLSPNISNVYDCQGKTIRPTQDMEYLFNCPRGPENTLKNAVIDLDHKKMKAVFNCQGVLKLENVSIINAENVDYGVSIWANEAWNEHFSANNCQFGQFHIAAILQSTPRYNYRNVQPRVDADNLNWVNSNQQFVKIDNCTFNGGGQPGFGIIDCYGFIGIENCTFTGYNGAVPTGITAANDSSDGLNPYLVYRGIPNAAPSAAVLLKEMAAASVTGNTINLCDNGIQVWSGEGNFNHYDIKPPAGYQGFVKVNGSMMNSLDIAAQVRNTLLGANSITASNSAVQVKYALDRYNLNDVFPDFQTSALSDLDAKILAGNVSDTLNALKAELLGLTGIIDDNKINYQNELAAARTTKGNPLTFGEVQAAVNLANDKVDVAAAKANCIKNGVDCWSYHEIGEMSLPWPAKINGVSAAWTKVSGPDASRVTLDNGKATLNSLPGTNDPDGSVALTLTLTKGQASDTVDYTYAVSGKPVNVAKPVGIVSSPLITMASDQVNIEPGDKWIIKITSAEWDQGTTIKDTLNNNDLTVTGLPDGMSYTAVKGSGNTVEITVNGPARNPVTGLVNVGIIVKGSAVTQTGISDSNSFGVMIAPYAEEDIIDYVPGPMGSPFLDSWIPETIAWNQFQRDAQVQSIKTVTLQKPIYMFKEDDVDESKPGKNMEYVLDFQGKTIKAGNDMDFLLCSERGETVTIKNAIIDMNHKNVKTVFNDKGRIHLENVKIINAENVNYGTMLWANYGYNEQFVADGCQFPNFKVAAVLQWTPIFLSAQKAAADALPAQVKLVNSTFDGGGLPGYGVIGCYGSLVVEDCTFKGYKGALATGINLTNDVYVPLSNPPYGESKSILGYNGIPDGSPSAAILLKEVSITRVSENTISDCDNGILVWTGEKNFRHDDLKPANGYTGLVTVNGFQVSDQNSAEQAYESLANGNIIGLATGSTGSSVVIENAADRYNRISLYEPMPVQIGTAPVLNGQDVKTVKAGETYNFSVGLDNLGTEAQQVKVYAVARGGRGARLDHGGTVLSSAVKDVSLIDKGSMALDFTLPADIVGKEIYVDVYVWDSGEQSRTAQPAHFSYSISG